MLRRLKPTLFSILLFALLALPVLPAKASSYMEPKGLVLGGSLDAPVRIEVFSNFECPHCREYYLRTIKKVLKEYSSQDKVCVIYHDFPFQYHKYDRTAARYAEAAYRVGRETALKVFDAFYTDQADWIETGKLESVLKKALSKEEYQEVMENAKDPELDSIVEAQYELATEKGLTSTPTSFIFSPGKEQKVSGLLTYVVLKGFIDKIVK